MDVKSYQQEFISFRPQLQSYLYRLVTSRQEAEDLTQDTFIKVFNNLTSFKKNSSFKTWAFTIATNLARDSQRAQLRWGRNWMDLVRDAHVADPSLMHKKRSIVEESPHGKFVLSEHLNYCFTCTSKTLLVENQICLWLKEVYDFKISEIMVIINLSEGKVKHALADARKDMATIFEQKCALINKHGTCSQCTGLNQMYNPRQEAQAEANKLKMVREGAGKDSDELLNLRLQLIKTIDPLNGEGIDLHNYLLENSPAWAKEQARKSAL